MKSIELWDLHQDTFLSLREILATLPPRALVSSWAVSEFVYTNGERYFDMASAGDDHISRLEKAGTRVSGEELVAIAVSCPQVIWATFRAHEPVSAAEPWIELHAIDSTFWRCETHDVATREALMRSFGDVRLSQ